MYSEIRYGINPAALLLFSIGVLACRAQAAIAPQPGTLLSGQLIVFDAAEGKFDSSSSRPINARKPVVVVLKRVDTFRHKYTIKQQTTDFHNLSVPAALGSIVSTKAPNIVSGASFGDVARTITGLPSPLDKDFEKVKRQAENVDKKIGIASDPSTIGIISRIRQYPTNYDIRLAVVEYIHSHVSASTTAADDDRAKQDIHDLISPVLPDNMTDNVGAYRQMRPEIDRIADLIVTNDQLKDVDEASTSLGSALDKWNTDYASIMPTPTPNTPAFAANAAVATLVSSVADRVKTIQQQRPVVKNLYYTALDPVLVPTKLTKELGKINADELEVTVQDDLTSPAYLSIDPSSDKNVLNSIGTPDVSVTSRVVKVSAPTYWRLVLDYSAGIATTSLKQKNFYVDKNSTPHAVRLGLNDNTNLGIAALAHVYFTTNLPLGLSPGLCFGAVATDPVRYVAGGSVIVHLTRRIRLSYSYGWAWGKVTELNGDVLNGDKLTPPVPALGDAPVTASRMEQGTFNAVTLSFSF